MSQDSRTGIVTDMEEVRGQFFSRDFDEHNWKAWKYKLRLGEEVYISTDNEPVDYEIGRASCRERV